MEPNLIKCKYKNKWMNKKPEHQSDARIALWPNKHQTNNIFTIFIPTHLFKRSEAGEIKLLLLLPIFNKQQHN